MRLIRSAALVLLTGALALIGARPVSSQTEVQSAAYMPDLAEVMNLESSEMRDLLDRYVADRAGLQRRHDTENSEDRRAWMRAFYRSWLDQADRIDFEGLGIDGRIDHILFRSRLEYELLLLDREERILTETADLIPFAETIIGFQVSRRSLLDIAPEASARALTELAKQVERVQKAVDEGSKQARAGEEGSGEPGAAERGAGGAGAAAAGEGRTRAPAATTSEEEEIEPIETTITVAYRAARTTDRLRRTLENWFEYYNGYHPMFTWWAADPYAKADKALEDYAKFLREKIVGYKEGEDPPIVGDPIGTEELLVDLKYEFIPYTPDELVAIANREFAWCEREMLRAAQDLGYGEDWRAALEHVKTLHVAPGDQPDLIRDLALEAIAFVEERDLLTVPELAKDMWRVEMMSPERQKVSPFFLGGEVIQVSFPTDEMTHEEKLMSMRGNNIHFARATVQHELIPGHHLQGFMTDRYNRHRRIFGTPFWTEGWALYWEMRLWDLDFPQSPENRIGMLFWRMHRCARIIFSLGFHMGTMTPQECVDFLVERVGHERANAEAEVRRSFEGSYSPLYQLAYMIGGLQFRGLHEEMVGSGRMTEREFHDAILRMGTMPVEMVRARLLGTDLPRDFTSSWRFAGTLPGR